MQITTMHVLTPVRLKILETGRLGPPLSATRPFEASFLPKPNAVPTNFAAKAEPTSDIPAMSKLQQIAQWLSAGGASVSIDEKNTFFYHEEDGILWVRTWTGHEYSDPITIAENVRKDTPVVAILDQAHESNTLQCYTNPGEDAEEDEPWSQQDLGLGNVKVHPRSQLAMDTTANEAIIFYQDTDGFMSTVQGSDKNWRVTRLPGGSVLPGTPLAHFSAGQKEYLFHATNDRTIHHLVRQVRQGEWKDELFSPATIDSDDCKLAIAEENEPGKSGLMVFAVGDGKLHIVTPKDESMRQLGYVQDGEYRSMGRQERSTYGYQWDPYGYRPAVNVGDLRVVKMLPTSCDGIVTDETTSQLPNKSICLPTPLTAAGSGHLETVKLRDKLKDIVLEEGNGIALVATAYSPASIVEAKLAVISKRHIGILKGFIQYDLSFVNMPDDRLGITPLYMAANEGQRGLMGYLLSLENIQPNVRMKKGDTPLDIFTQYLRVSDVNIGQNSQDNKGASYLIRAVE
ncbi:hypothetical protein PT974_09665 [Cladobotryum mycophilum]|uniref:Fucose-specific lectin n=1 Tax=Cladobotryum mycophilum TaxID=491253 RepID=A0ABR0SHA9_9HYPO